MTSPTKNARLNLITTGIVLSLFLASMEGTVVATAMPTIVSQLGGLSIYSWVFAIYMLTSTTTVPLYGKLSDIYGRKRVYLFSMALFLVGSVVCGLAGSMEQLIAFRALQGLGAGGVLPLAFTIVGELFTLEQRAKLQGFFSGIWGVSAIIGPLIGGFLVDQISWQWVFFINLIPGGLAIGLVWLAWSSAFPSNAVEVTAATPPKSTRLSIDFPGALLLTLGGITLLIGMNQLGKTTGWWSLGGAALCIAGLFWVEPRAADPILPLRLFRERLFSVAILNGFLAGWAMFGTLSYVPLFVQGVLGTSATQAGIALTPMSLAWTLASIFSSRQLLKTSYRTLALIGMSLLSLGSLCMTLLSPTSTTIEVMLFTGMMGLGMGLSVPAFLVAVQSAVRRQDLGSATSTLTFSRSIGGTIGVSLMGALLSASLASHLISAGLPPDTSSLNSLLDPLARASASVEGEMKTALASASVEMFRLALVAALAGLIATTFAPRGTISQIIKERTSQEKNITESGI